VKLCREQRASHIARQPETLKFVFTVLSCDEETAKKLSEEIDGASERFEHDRKAHNFIMTIRSIPVAGCTSPVDSPVPRNFKAKIAVTGITLGAIS